MKNFALGILAGLILFVGYNNKSALATAGINIIKKTGTAFNNAFAPPIQKAQAAVQPVEKQVVKATKQMAQNTQRVVEKVINVAHAETTPPRPVVVQNFNKPISQNVSQYKIKRQNSRTSISLVTE